MVALIGTTPPGRAPHEPATTTEPVPAGRAGAGAGMAIARRFFELCENPLASMPVDDLVAMVAPSIQATLTGSAADGAASP